MARFNALNRRGPCCMGHQLESAVLDRPQSLIGVFRRFGPAGPIYEVIGILPGSANRDRFMMVRVVESGENVVSHRGHSWRSGGALMFAIAFDLVVADTAPWIAH